MPPFESLYPAGLKPDPQYGLTSSLYNQQGNTLQAAINAAQAGLQGSFYLPLQLTEMRTRLLQNRSQVNPNFSPNRARRAFLGGF